MESRIWVETRLAGRVLERRLVAQVNREATGKGPRFRTQQAIPQPVV